MTYREAEALLIERYGEATVDGDPEWTHDMIEALIEDPHFLEV